MPDQAGTLVAKELVERLPALFVLFADLDCLCVVVQSDGCTESQGSEHELAVPEEDVGQVEHCGGMDMI